MASPPTEAPTEELDAPTSPSDLHSSLAAVDLDEPFSMEAEAEAEAEEAEGVVEEAVEASSSEDELAVASPPPPLTDAAASALHTLLSDAAAVVCMAAATPPCSRSRHPTPVARTSRGLGLRRL